MNLTVISKALKQKAHKHRVYTIRFNGQERHPEFVHPLLPVYAVGPGIVKPTRSAQEMQRPGVLGSYLHVIFPHKPNMKICNTIEEGCRSVSLYENIS